jgi:hypothetical protein|tara:strand:+ start:192 stop:455 length:264 start_codon:yes stop_codon:yes gene_type:complete
MLKKIYRAMVMAHAGSTAVKIVEHMTDAQLQDIGISRSKFPVEAMKAVEADFAQKDSETQEKRNARGLSSLSAATLLNHSFLQSHRT